MVAQEFLSHLDKFHFVDAANLHDFADRCAYLLSFIVLLICFAIVSLKSYVFEPLSCYVATSLSGANLVSFIHTFCWVNGTVPADVNTERLSDPEYWRYLETKKLNYYQWISLVLALQAILCYLPSLIWEALTFNRVGTNLNFYIESAQSASKETGLNRKTRIHNLASALDTLLFARRPLPCQPRSSIFYRTVDLVKELLPQKRLGRALCAYYLMIKLLYFANAVFQLLIMERFLGMEGNHFFGVQVLSDLWHGRQWQETLVFPRVGYCHIPFTLVGFKSPALTVQCTMPINMLSEKIYIFLWFWFVGVATLQAISITTWVLRLSVQKRRLRALIHYLKVCEAYEQGMRETLKRFECSCLRPDGSFILHMMRINAGDVITNEILQALFERYLRHEKQTTSLPIQEDKPTLVTSSNDSLKGEKIGESCAVKNRRV